MSSGTKTVLKNKRRWSFLAHAVIWIIAIAGGTAFAKLVYPEVVKPGRISLAERITKYQESWQEALKRVGAHEPPKVEDVVAQAPWGQQNSLHVKLDQIYKDNLPKFLDKARDHLAQLEKEFKAEWQECYDEFADTPTVEKYCERIHEYHHEAMKDRFKKVDDTLKKKQPRTRLALDSFSGYCVLRSKEFRERASARDLKLHLMDDGADYEKRIKALESGEVEMAVFTLDALINNSALFGVPPAQVVLVLDETRGADAMVSYVEALPNIAAMNSPNTEIILTPNSPSELLVRLVRNDFKLPKLPAECSFYTKDAAEVFKRFQEADPSEPKAFVLWEPYVSKVKENKKAHILIDSSNPNFRGYIVDVLVARKEFLEANKEEVQAIIRTYLETAAEFQKAPGGMNKLVQADSVRLAVDKKLPEALTDKEADSVVKGIWWKTTEENYGHFGLLGSDPDQKHQLLEEMIKNITSVLTKAKVINKTVKTNLLFHKGICGELLAEKFDPTKATVSVPMPMGDPWSRLKAVRDEKVTEIPFATGSNKISDLYEPDLKDVADKLLLKPRYYVEVRGHSHSGEMVDLELARVRAEAVEKWLHIQGIVKDRIKITVKMPEAGKPKGIVSIVVFE